MRKYKINNMTSPKFIPLTNDDGKTILVNLSYITEIDYYQDGATRISMANDDVFAVKETVEEIIEIIKTFNP